MPVENDKPITALFYSVKDAADMLAVSPWAIKDYLRRDLLEGRKAGRRTLVTAASLHARAAQFPKAVFLPPRQKRGA
jgi:hypothetical protein